MTPELIKLNCRLRRGEFDLEADLNLPGQGITAIFGRSGSGKTSLLRCMAGLEPRCRGEIVVRDQVWQDGDTFVRTHKRPLGYVTQASGLFPHLSVQGNLDFAIRRASEGALALDQVIAMMGLAPILKRDPGGLSGGERQRVAIARALLIGPRLLLMDEPMASLDDQSKQEIMPYLDGLHRELGIPVLYVSHSADEVARLADYLVVMDRGCVVGHGPLEDMLSRVDFPIRLGDDVGVVLSGKVVEQDSSCRLSKVRTPGGELWVRGAGESLEEPVRLRILARDVSLALSHHEDSSILNILPGEIEEVAREINANSSLVRINLGSATLLARVTLRSVERLDLKPGMKVWAQIKSVALVT